MSTFGLPHLYSYHFVKLLFTFKSMWLDFRWSARHVPMDKNLQDMDHMDSIWIQLIPNLSWLSCRKVRLIATFCVLPCWLVHAIPSSLVFLHEQCSSDTHGDLCWPTCQQPDHVFSLQSCSCFHGLVFNFLHKCIWCIGCHIIAISADSNVDGIKMDYVMSVGLDASSFVT